jgi:hypothetical protein
VDTNEHRVTAMNDVSCDWSRIASDPLRPSTVRGQLLLKVAAVLFSLAALALVAVVFIFHVDAIVGGKFGAAVALVAVLAAVNTCMVVAAAIAEHLSPTGSLPVL